MRTPTDAAKVGALMERIGRDSRGPGRVYLVGGASAVLVGWRPTTVDADLKLDPEPEGVFDSIARLKEDLDMNVELSAPDDFMPPVPGWVERSVFVARFGQVDFYHYDFYAQALAKIERGHARDLDDVRAMHAAGLIEPARLRDLFEAMAPMLIRYPAIEPEALRDRLESMLTELGHD
jgi:hypothetical protein